ncbi:MAG: UTP--glucose-1-phosphate uridylyltransferase, partial [Desulfobacterales bacterium]
DLLAIRSDGFLYTDTDGLTVNPARRSSKRETPVKVKLDRRFYGKIDLLEARFSAGVPSLVDCDALAVEGDVYFESDVTIRGSVLIKNSRSSPAVIKKGTTIDRDLIL